MWLEKKKKEILSRGISRFIFGASKLVGLLYTKVMETLVLARRKCATDIRWLKITKLMFGVSMPKETS